MKTIVQAIQDDPGRMSRVRRWLFSRQAFVLFMLGVAVILAYVTVNVQVEFLGVRFLTVQQYEHHRRVLEGVGGNPWQYRLLSEYLVEPVIRALTAIRYDKPIVNGFILFRYIQNSLIFILAALYYRKLGLNRFASLIGLTMIAWGMTQSLYDSDLSFNLYFDIVFYLLAGLVILHDKPVWLIPIMVLAALNRETSGLIPLMLLVYIFLREGKAGLVKKSTISILGAVLAVYTVIFVGLRLAYGAQPFISAYGIYPGIHMFNNNVGRPITWVHGLATLGIIPLLALAVYPHWQTSLKAFGWAIVPLWFTIHLFTAILAESRLLLAPQVMVFIPGVLAGLVALSSKEKRAEVAS